MFLAHLKDAVEANVVKLSAISNKRIKRMDQNNQLFSVAMELTDKNKTINKHISFCISL